MTLRAPHLAAVAAAMAGALAGCGGSGESRTETAAVERATVAATSPVGARHAATEDAATDAVAFTGGIVSPVTTAPELGLPSWNGKERRLRDYAGNAVLVTFVYTNCPDFCPLVLDKLQRVQRHLGPAGKRMRIVAISVDPEGDTPGAVNRFLTRHKMKGRVDYLIGTRDQLEQAWARWGVASRRSFDDPHLVEHSGVIWGVDARGRRVTFYPATGFEVADIARDVRLMLAAGSP